MGDPSARHVDAASKLPERLAALSHEVVAAQPCQAHPPWRHVAVGLQLVERTPHPSIETSLQNARILLKGLFSYLPGSHRWTPLTNFFDGLTPRLF